MDTDVFFSNLINQDSLTSLNLYLYWSIYMKTINKLTNYFSKLEIALWLTSITLIVSSFCIFDRVNYLTLIASLIGVTSIIINAKGNPLGQFLMIIFSLLYGIISYTFSYYGEMITYLGMTMPMALFSLVAWLRHPFKGKKSEVEVNQISKILTYIILSRFEKSS